MSLFRETPLIYSQRISEIVECDAYLKLETLQPSHSFKSRGISWFLRNAKEKYGAEVHAIVASGGNAGIAAACAARVLSLKCTVYIPEGVSETTLNFLRSQGAEVVISGRIYAEALDAARTAVQQENNAVMVPAYDDPLVWDGHATMISEISQQLSEKPDAIFCSVGGAGLLGGIMVGCKNVGWDDVPIVALATIGSNAFHYSLLLNQNGSSEFIRHLPPYVVHDDSSEGIPLARFTKFSSKASGSLGSSVPSAGVIKMAGERRGPVIPVSVPDELSMQAAVSFANHHKTLVELACSTTLTPGYSKNLFNTLLPGKKKTVVFIVCGGFKVSIEDIVEYGSCVEASVKNGADRHWEVVYGDGKLLNLEKQGVLL